MKIVTLSKNQYEKLLPLDIPREVFNTEARMFRYTTPRREEKVVKSLYNTEGETFGGKLYTLEMLNKNAEYLPENFVIPDSLLSVRDNIVGFTIPYIEGINLSTIINDPKLSVKEQLYYLKKVGELLQQLKSIREYTPLTNIYLNDLHESNFIVNPKKRSIYAIDLDSCKIGNNICFTSRFLTPFSLAATVPQKYHENLEEKGPGVIIPDENTDLLCYNLMVLNYLRGINVDSLPNSLIMNHQSNISSLSIKEAEEISYEERLSLEFYEYLNYLEAIGISKELLECFSKILGNCPNENPVNYLDTITTEQVARSRENVYRLTKQRVMTH